MHQIIRIVLICIMSINITASSKMRIVTTFGSNSSSSVIVWVYFNRKNLAEHTPLSLPQRTLNRRRNAGFINNLPMSAPVSQEFLDKITDIGGVLRHIYKWENAASFKVPIEVIPTIKTMPFVKEVTLVGRIVIPQRPGLHLAKNKYNVGKNRYGTLFHALEQLNIPAAHYYLDQKTPEASPGKGALIAVFDNGFTLQHRCFNNIKERGGILATKNFTEFQGEDSTVVTTNDYHGSMVLSLLAGYDPPYFCGVSWGADYLLARTEVDNEYDSHTEEDNWAAAVVWAEEYGVDIISSSLGYRDDYSDTVIIINDSGNNDTLTNYRIEDLDGNTTIVSRAAGEAVKRGVIVVNANGNEQTRWGVSSLSAPADVNGVIAVGAIDDENKITGYSSLGPTADGRIKPDVCAPGNVFVPDIGSTHDTLYSVLAKGTSLATPLVAGICALVKQQYHEMNSTFIRNRIVSHCIYAPDQHEVNNIYGYGIPDAASSCIADSNELLLQLTGVGNMPIIDADVFSKNMIQNAVTSDSNGFALITLASDVDSAENVILHAKGKERSLYLTPGFYKIVPCSVTVQVRGTTTRLENDTVCFITKNEKECIQTDSKGIAVFSRFFIDTVMCVVKSPGYMQSDTLRVVLNEESTIYKSVTLIEHKNEFVVYPTVYKRNSGKKLFFHYNSPEKTDFTDENFLTVSIRSFDGNLIWKEKKMSSGKSLVTWNGCNRNGREVCPGTYIAGLQYKNKRFRKKILIVE